MTTTRMFQSAGVVSVLILGMKGTGKSTIAARLMDKEPESTYTPTKDFDLWTKVSEVNNNRIRLQVQEAASDANVDHMIGMCKDMVCFVISATQPLQEQFSYIDNLAPRLKPTAKYRYVLTHTDKLDAAKADKLIQAVVKYSSSNARKGLFDNVIAINKNDVGMSCLYVGAWYLKTNEPAIAQLSRDTTRKSF
jgi:hypothetical protein